MLLFELYRKSAFDPPRTGSMRSASSTGRRTRPARRSKRTVRCVWPRRSRPCSNAWMWEGRTRRWCPRNTSKWW